MAERFALRRRFLWGVVLGALLAVGLAWAMLAAALAEDAALDAERHAVVRVMALADLVTRAGGSGESAQQVARAWAAGATDVGAARLVNLDERLLEFSTAAVDVERGATPRRLVREEKPYFDLAQVLRGAVTTNRAENAAREEVVRIERGQGGLLVLTAPVERDGTVIGMVQVETAAGKVVSGRGLPASTLWLLGAVVAFVLLALAIGERRGLLVALGAACVLVAVAGFGGSAFRVWSVERGERAEALAASLAVEQSRAQAVLAASGVEAGTPLDAATWDVDVFGRPRGLVHAGAVDKIALEGRIALGASQLRRLLAGLAALGLALFAWIGLGGAGKTWATLKRFHVAYAYTAPALLGMLVLVFFPFFYGIALAFTNSNIYNSDKPISEIWVGLQNFKEILIDFDVVKKTADGTLINFRNFYYTFAFTVIWTVSNVCIGVSVGLILALILNTKGLALKPVYRVLLVLPWAVPNYITALIWRGMFHQQFGVVNQMLQIVGMEPVSWFERPVSSFATVLATNGWLSFPFMMVISLGALQSIPADLYEAARVDGASRWQQFTSITLPSLKPALIPAIILSVIWTFNMFNIIFLVSQGEPAGSTEILITQAYKIAFEQYRYGYAAAYSTVIFLILLAYGTWQNRVTRATEGI